MSKENGIIIFIKNPELGKVKTRLAKDLGDEKALNIYKALLSYTRKVSRTVPASRFLFYSNNEVINDDWSREYFIKDVQAEGGLGVRIQEAFTKVLLSCEKAVIIGSDCAQITPDIIDQAFQSLASKDLVIGPTYDGGYYLLGIKKLHTFLFDDIPWSSGQEFGVSVRRALKNKLSIEILQTLSDIDYKEDWEKYGWDL